VVAIDATGLMHFAGPGGIVSTAAANASPPPRIYGITNAAWGSLDGRVAPGELVSLYGPHIGPTPAAVYTSGDVPKSLGGVQVLFDDLAAPLLYAGDSQINAVVPFGVSDRPSTRVRIVSKGVSNPDFQATVLLASPQIFQDPSQAAAAINQDGTINGPDHPAPPGSIVSIWATGAIVPSLPDGEIATEAHYYACCQLYSGSTMLRMLYSGAAPGMVAGVVQINFQVPADAAGLTYLTLVAGNRESNPAYIVVAARD
jgi:uncharacterized protein (TIGR03437 family)